MPRQRAHLNSITDNILLEQAYILMYRVTGTEKNQAVPETHVDIATLSDKG
jgi:hypothetical protein